MLKYLIALCGYACVAVAPPFVQTLTQASAQSLVQAAQTKASRPNVVFIITDDQARDQYGFLDGKALTPNLDRLATQGVYFSRAYAASSVCSPSRYTCLTGQYASRCMSKQFTKQTSEEGMTLIRWNVGFEPDQPTLPKVLQQAGYQTGFVGKWHINSLKRPHLLPKGSDPADPEVIAKLTENQAAFSKNIQSFGFDFAKNIYAGNPLDDKSLKATGLAEHNMEWVTQAAIEFIEQSTEAKKPFYLYFSTTLPHFPRPLDSFLNDERLTPIGQLDQPIRGVQPSRQSVVNRCKQAGIEQELWPMTWMDDGIGALMSKLEELDIADNTLIIYFNDHGMENSAKGTNYEGGIVTPTMAYWPGHSANGPTDRLIQNTDFAPTIMDFCGATPPPNMIIDGHSIRGLIEGRDEPVRTSVYSEIGMTRAITREDGMKYMAFRVPPSYQRTLSQRMVDQEKSLAFINKEHPWTIGAKWGLDPEARYFHLGMEPGGAFLERLVFIKPVPFADSYFDPDQLYDLNTDPFESNNLADDPAYAQTLKELQDQLAEYLDGLPGTFAELKPMESSMSKPQ